ncbi:hypothetical protein [Catenovulum sediminis]|uniref:hypothetical protein n=1 Tax=Catenovulum sediminis TaxID=1740262 RepID=UPI00117EADFD|nr:hypothetical protein [Catenovulum sediminis]
MAKNDKTQTLRVITRILTAFVGGFILTNQFAILISYQAQEAKNVDSIVGAMMLSFILYALIIIYVFACKSTTRALLSISALCSACFALMAYLEWVFR